MFARMTGLWGPGSRWDAGEDSGNPSDDRWINGALVSALFHSVPLRNFKAV
jgi:hypothetical protein